MSFHNDILQSFAHQLGIANPNFDENSVCIFEFEKSGQLHVEKYGDELLIYLIKEGGFLSYEQALAVLEKCRPRRHDIFCLTFGYYRDGNRDTRIVLARVAEGRCDLPVFHKIIETLISVQERCQW